MRFSTNHLTMLIFITGLAIPTLAAADDDVSTVNKSVSISSGSGAGDVESVNGSIRIGADAFVQSVESVNGAVNIGEGVTVAESVEAVNGGITLGPGSIVGGSVETVNGGIRLSGTNVSDHVETINGSIRLLQGTVVEGNVKVGKSWGWSSGRNKPVKVEIGEDVQVLGDLIFERPVELKLHDSASVGEIIGKQVELVQQ